MNFCNEKQMLKDIPTTEEGIYNSEEEA